MRRGANACQFINLLEHHRQRDSRKCASITLGMDEWCIQTIQRTLLYECLDFLADARGQNDSASFRSLCLMHVKLDLASSFTVLIDDITDGKCGNLANPQT